MRLPVCVLSVMLPTPVNPLVPPTVSTASAVASTYFTAPLTDPPILATSLPTFVSV